MRRTVGLILTVAAMLFGDATTSGLKASETAETRYQIMTTGHQMSVWRLETRTGRLERCEVELAGQIRCVVAPDPTKPQ
jgi:hypothetical protein